MFTVSEPILSVVSIQQKIVKDYFFLQLASTIVDLDLWQARPTLRGARAQARALHANLSFPGQYLSVYKTHFVVCSGSSTS